MRGTLISPYNHDVNIQQQLIDKVYKPAGATDIFYSRERQKRLGYFYGDVYFQLGQPRLVKEQRPTLKVHKYVMSQKEMEPSADL
jgi:hypothetical protein